MSSSKASTRFSILKASVDIQAAIVSLKLCMTVFDRNFISHYNAYLLSPEEVFFTRVEVEYGKEIVE